MQQRKSPDPDEIPKQMLSALAGPGIDLLWNLIDRIYETGMFPDDMLKSVSITLQRSLEPWLVQTTEQLG